MYRFLHRKLAQYLYSLYMSEIMIYLYNAIYASVYFCDLAEDKAPLPKHSSFGF